MKLKLGVVLDEIAGRWAFVVSGATHTGFVATATGRPGSTADGFIVTLRFERGADPVWRVERRRLR